MTGDDLMRIAAPVGWLSNWQWKGESQSSISQPAMEVAAIASLKLRIEPARHHRHRHRRLLFAVCHTPICPFTPEEAYTIDFN